MQQIHVKLWLLNYAFKVAMVCSCTQYTQRVNNFDYMETSYFRYTTAAQQWNVPKNSLGCT